VPSPSNAPAASRRYPTVDEIARNAVTSTSLAHTAPAHLIEAMRSRPAFSV